MTWWQALLAVAGGVLLLWLSLILVLWLSSRDRVRLGTRYAYFLTSFDSWRR
jgi:hypothetical protein